MARKKKIVVKEIFVNPNVEGMPVRVFDYNDSIGGVPRRVNVPPNSTLLELLKAAAPGFESIKGMSDPQLNCDVILDVCNLIQYQFFASNFHKGYRVADICRPNLGDTTFLFRVACMYSFICFNYTYC